MISSIVDCYTLKSHRLSKGIQIWFQLEMVTTQSFVFTYYVDSNGPYLCSDIYDEMTDVLLRQDGQSFHLLYAQGVYSNIKPILSSEYYLWTVGYRI